MNKSMPGSVVSGIFFFSVLFFLASPLAGQSKVPLLERTVTIAFEQERLDVALKKIAAQTGFTFSYNSRIVEGDKKVTYNFQSKTVREILDQLFKGNVTYKEKGKYIILTKAEVRSSQDAKVLTGYVIDEATGERLKQVSVYDPVSLSSAVTDDFGYFEIEIKKPTHEEIKLAINKRDYTDTLIFVPKGGSRLLNIPIKIDNAKINSLVDSAGKKLKRAWLYTKNATIQAVNMENISDTMYRTVQFSVIPFVGTNGKLSGNVINDYSLSLLGGYSLGVQKLEVGGLFNAVRGNQKGIQIAGLANGVLGKNTGVQIAGLANAVMDSSTGPQVAGLVNFNSTSANKMGLAGLVNFSLGNSNGVMIAGLTNFSVRDQRGAHIAGLFNFSARNSGPAHIAGLFNFTNGSMHGVQMAGLFNVAIEQIRGAQISGLFNVAPVYVKGIQLAPFNFAKRVEGSQIGLFNFSKSTNGVPIGLLSIVGKGYHKLEISADEIFYTNLSFRTGVRQFYNIITAGAKPDTFEDDGITWTFGYGIGSAPKITRWLYLNFDLTSNQIVQGNTIEAINLLNKFYIGFDFQLAKKFSITTGITLNGLITETNYSAYPELFSDYKPDIIHEQTFSNDLNLKMWLGGKIGVRFF